MKIHEEIINPQGTKALLFRTNYRELAILRSLVAHGLALTPRTDDTATTIELMRNMQKAFAAGFKLKTD